MKNEGFEVVAGGGEDAFVGAEERVFHHDDDVAQEALGTLLVELKKQLTGVVGELHRLPLMSCIGVTVKQEDMVILAQHRPFKSTCIANKKI